MADARERDTRKADTLAMLATPAIDVWVATASREANEIAGRTLMRDGTWLV